MVRSPIFTSDSGLMHLLLNLHSTTLSYFYSNKSHVLVELVFRVLTLHLFPLLILQLGLYHLQNTCIMALALGYVQ